MPYAYRKSERIRKNSEYLAAMKEKRLSIDGLSLFYARNGLDHYRVGISVSKKLANAVGRNRLRRRIRSCVMAALADCSAGYDLVFVARRELANQDFPRIRQVVMRAVQKSSVCRTGAGGAR